MGLTDTFNIYNMKFLVLSLCAGLSQAGVLVSNAPAHHFQAATAPADHFLAATAPADHFSASTAPAALSNSPLLLLPLLTLFQTLPHQLLTILLMDMPLLLLTLLQILLLMLLLILLLLLDWVLLQHQFQE